MKTLSVCIIAKNEQDTLPRCIASIEHIADEIIVVDTGSSDYTKDIAKGFGARLIDYKFNNDFSKARNISIENASCDWILYIDCDEVLDFYQGYDLKEIINNNKYVGICLKLSNINNGKMGLTLSSLRVIKNNEGFRFTGKIHEQILPSILEKYKQEDILTTEVQLYHYGYDKSLVDSEYKHKRNLDIFEDYEEKDKDGFYYYNLASQYMSSGDFDKAIDLYEKSMEFDDNINGYKLYIPIYISKSYYDMKEYKKASECALRFIKQYPTFKDLHFLAGASFYEQNDYIRAKGFFLNYIDLLNKDYGYPEYNLSSYDDISKILVDINVKILELL